MGKILDAIKTYFEAEDLKFEFTARTEEDELDTFETGFISENGNIKIRIIVSEKNEWFIVIGYPQFTVPKSGIDKAIKAVNITNRKNLFVMTTVDPEDVVNLCFGLDTSPMMELFNEVSRNSSSHRGKCGKRPNPRNYESSIPRLEHYEGIIVVQEVIYGYWKPRHLMNTHTKCAYVFMTDNEYFVSITTYDIDWESVDKLPSSVIAHRLSAHYPTIIRKFENGVALVSWQLNPDGFYFMDDDGFGMTDDEKEEIYGFIDTNCKVVVKFRTIEDYHELDKLRSEAEKINKGG